MDLSHVEAFMMGFVLATVLYFVIWGIAWIDSIRGMDREDSQALVELTNGKTSIEINEIMHEGYKQIQERDLLRKRLDAEASSILIAAEIERLSRQLLNCSLVAEKSGAKDIHIN